MFCKPLGEYLCSSIDQLAEERFRYTVEQGLSDKPSD